MWQSGGMGNETKIVILSAARSNGRGDYLLAAAQACKTQSILESMESIRLMLLEIGMKVLPEVKRERGQFLHGWDCEWTKR